MPMPLKKPKKEVLKFEEERNQALLRGDTETLDHMYADELAWTNPSGEILTKAQVLANLKSETQNFFRIKHDDRSLLVYGDTVVLTAHTVSTERYKGNTFNYPRRSTNVYIKRDGRWELIAHHATQKGDSDTADRICAGSGEVGHFEVSASSVRHIDWYHAFCQEADTSAQVNRYEEGPAGGEKAPIRAIQR
jgi:ketosteroid isomerase-like protein